MFRAILFFRFLGGDVTRDQVAQCQEVAEGIVVGNFFDDFLSIIEDVRVQFSCAWIGGVGTLYLGLVTLLQRNGHHQKQRTIRAV